jgi:hypothetical protein
MSNNTGGPAFPTEAYDFARQTVVREEGMTLRDYFAAKAMQAIIGDPKSKESTPAFVSEWAWKHADAMLKARGS